MNIMDLPMELRDLICMWAAYGKWSRFHDSVYVHSHWLYKARKGLLKENELEGEGRYWLPTAWYRR